MDDIIRDLGGIGGEDLSLAKGGIGARGGGRVCPFSLMVEGGRHGVS